jgi:hypothetical protein
MVTASVKEGVAVPTVLRSGPYRFFFYSGDCSEPPHIHAERDDDEAKFWLDPVRLQKSVGFRRREVGRLRELVIENRDLFMGVWDEHCND